VLGASRVESSLKLKNFLFFSVIMAFDDTSAKDEFKSLYDLLFQS
jgi:hypothetical protein